LTVIILINRSSGAAKSLGPKKRTAISYL